MIPAARSALVVAVHRVGRERGQADRDVGSRRPPPARSSAPTRRRARARPGRRGRRASPPSCSTCRQPSRTSVHSSNSGRWPGSTQPAGDVMRAMLRRVSPVLTRPTNSSISFGLVPAASIVDGRCDQLRHQAGESTRRRRASTAPDREPVGDVVGPLARPAAARRICGSRRPITPRSSAAMASPPSSAAGELAARRERALEHDRPAERERQVDRHRRGEQRQRAALARQQQRPGGARPVEHVVAARERDQRRRRAADGGGDEPGLERVHHGRERTR